MGEDRGLQLPQLFARFQPELIEQRAPGVRECLERLGLTAGAVEREHQLRSQPLAQRVLLDERGELAGHLLMASEREIGLDAPLERDEPALLEPRDLALSEVVVCEVGKRRTAPQRQRLTEPFGRASRLGFARAVDELLEAVQIELPGRELQQVAAGTGNERVGAQRLSQLRDVALKSLHGGVRAIIAPELVDQSIAWDELIRVQQQDRQQLALSATADREGSIAIDDFEWAKDSNFHVAP